MTGLFAGGGVATATAHPTRDGHTIYLDAYSIRATPIGSVDALSREAMLSADVHAAIRGITVGESVRATLEVGYQIGYPVSVAPTGVQVTAHTPELTLNAGVNAKINPNVQISGSGGGGSVGELGAQAGAEATVIPAADLVFQVGAGRVQTVTLAEISMTAPTSDIVLSGIQLSMSNAFGPVQVRPYAKISVATDTGIYVYTEYGVQRNI
ncbi:MspA family porin [Gordonia mangrovi]|uniref:MspA family porin n=1 Tax=Gordonia mangrovi TaxID=2665643 RepID=UPI0021ABA171|nr:MspA family porin [Gordonia mangrovi]UVF80026.1 MspA family porin [Gordonia mangrovi]